MLAKFENGYFLEVEHDEEEYNFRVLDAEGFDKAYGYTEYRSIDMYYPMNEIDYILNYCEPRYVEGKYEILKQKTFEEYEEYLDDLEYGELDGDWILERQGTDNDDIRYYKTEKDARTVMLKEVEECEDGDNQSISKYYCTVYGEEYFQSWSIYKNETFETKKDKLLNEIEMEFNRVYVGISQYAYELQDTDVIGSHVAKLKKLFNQLKEMM